MARDRLSDIQTLFHALVIAPEGVASGLAALGKHEGDLAEVVRGTERLGAVDRLDIYANMYFYRLLDVLRAEYERVVAEIGDARFHNLVTDYLIACPPRSPSLREAGDRFPAFVAAADLAPGLGALAALERARLEVFDDADAEVLTIDDLRVLPPERFAELPLRLIPAHRIVADRTLVWRQDLHVHHRALDADEPLELCDGRSFGALCDHLIAARPGADLAQLAFSLLGRWVQDGLIQKEPT